MGTRVYRAEVGRVGLLVVDVQERLAAVMPEKVMEKVAQQVGILLQSAQTLGIPVVVTEQYPKGIGPTVASVRAHLAEDWVPLEKLDFSCCAEPKIAEALAETKCDQWIVCGMETHICVFQTVRDLCEQGMEVFVPEDAVISRVKTNWRVGLEMMGRMGACRTSVEAVLFDLLVRAGTPQFKVISKLIR
ncbi:isochorismatase family protein [Myxococcota bacterium]|nr:isochorismatase family protein [Myxococcota bacterium]